MSKKVAMKKKMAFMNNVRDFVYLDTKRYVSLSALKKSRVLFIITILMVMMGIVGKSAFPIVSGTLWSLLYWIFILVIQSDRVKKTFELRFLVNGILGLFLSSLFWTWYASMSIISEHTVSDKFFVRFDFLMWILLYYLLFSVIYVAVVIFGIHKGNYGKIKKKMKSKTAVMIEAFSAALLPVSGLIGGAIERLIRKYASVNVKNVVDIIVVVLIIFLPAFMHIYFVQYYYCKKYGITCDENGDTTSPELERATKKHKRVVMKKSPPAIRILRVIACVFGLLLLIFFIIGLIVGPSHK